MSNNQDTIAEIRKFVNPIINSSGGSDIQKINLKDIKIAEGMTFNGIRLSEKAVRTVLGALKIKPQFLNFQDKMNAADWEMIGRKLKAARGDVPMYANVLNPSDKDKSEVYSLVLKNPKKKQSDDQTSSIETVNKIEEALAESEVNFGVAGLDFNPKNNMFAIELRNEDFTFDPFPGDTWKKGEVFNFNSLTFRNSPLVERLSCTNGMSTKNFGFASHIGQTRFNENKIEAEIRKSLLTDNEKVHEMVEHQLKRLKKTNVSIAEFFAWKKQIAGYGENYSDVADKYLDESHLYAAYKTELKDKPDIWKRTADTGINAYNFLNLITWIASHPKESGIANDIAGNMKISAGNFIFKKAFDLERIAEKVDITYPIMAEMQ